MRLKLIIFDLDGTLVDSSVDISNAINYAIEGLNIPPMTVSETISLIGEGITRLFERIIEKNRLSADKDPLIARFLEHYTVHLADNTSIYPGVRETLDVLGEYRKAVISNKREDLSVKILELLGIEKYFDVVVGSDTTAERKPSPVPLLHVLSRLNVEPAYAVMVGDSNLDIEAGKAAGLSTVAVTYGYRTRDKLSGADYIVDSMPEFIKIIKRWGS